jgi:hypothetical protein
MNGSSDDWLADIPLEGIDGLDCIYAVCIACYIADCESFNAFCKLLLH